MNGSNDLDESLFDFFLIGLVAFAAIFHFDPPNADVHAFNRWYDTKLPSREIRYKESGFVDLDFSASIPMSAGEFAQTVKWIGMKPVSAQRQRCGKRPWWCPEPKGQMFILDRLRDGNHRDCIEGHFDLAKRKAYFRYC